MNIFILDRDPVLAAQMQCDKHVVKMPLESAQMLSTAHRELDEFYGFIPSDSPIYKATHKNHACTVWVQQSVENYNWLYKHFVALSAEYDHRYYKLHKSWLVLREILSNPPHLIPECPMTPFAQAMPDEYKDDDPVVAYQNYYLSEKRSMLKYRKRLMPLWVEDAIGDDRVW